MHFHPPPRQVIHYVRRSIATAIMKLGMVIACVCLASCSRSGTTTETWRASKDNGDKPGIGIELIRSGTDVSGAIFLLDPNQPHDFTTGRRCPMTIERVDPQDLRFVVQFLPDQIDKMHLHFESQPEGERFQAILQRENGTDTPTRYDFHRIR